MRISLSRVRSATARRSRAFSVSSSFRRLTWFRRAWPDYPPARLFAAASHALLGREAEARAEVAAALRLSPTLTLANADGGRPFRPEVRERYLEALRRAGLPEPSPT